MEGLLSTGLPRLVLLERGIIGPQNETCGAIRPPCRAKKPSTAEAS